MPEAEEQLQITLLPAVDIIGCQIVCLPFYQPSFTSKYSSADMREKFTLHQPAALRKINSDTFLNKFRATPRERESWGWRINNATDLSC